MATDVVTIWNRALTAAGGRGLISSQTEAGREADLCRLWYPHVRDAALKAASWPCASNYARLALLAERTTTVWDATQPPPSWQFAYAVPSDMLAPRHLMSFGRFDRALWDGKNIIATNEADVILHYTARQEDVSRWDTGLEAAVIYSLAAQISLPLTGKSTRAQELASKANEVVLLARTEFANESDGTYEALPSWLQSRGFETLPNTVRFFWPTENFNALGA